jgi:hypothetical protein
MDTAVPDGRPRGGSGRLKYLFIDFHGSGVNLIGSRLFLQSNKSQPVS